MAMLDAAGAGCMAGTGELCREQSLLGLDKDAQYGSEEAYAPCPPLCRQLAMLLAGIHA